ncbi:hypothetical protein DFH08DRAFT_811899 [Mycena albidolilacea]|uniref:Uncharacterized protein n=1 Tax=Mycena albidolilacea TaxID=1033008 RepID=A0AAD7ENH3_9AGAR|nr:hypothetical protein DFH08DRAFT_811899 [Mycena albidolilacea]
MSTNMHWPLTFGQQILTGSLYKLYYYLSTAILPELGTIKVVYSLVKPTSHKQKIRMWNAKYELMTLYERSKKAIGHSVQYGFLLGIGLGAASDPLLEELLCAEDIAPPAEHTALQECAMTPSDLQLDALKKKKGKQVKQEHSNMKMKKEVKTEELIFAPGEVINLT